MGENSTGFNAEELRKKAEELLKNKDSKVVPQLSEADMQKLLHEFEVRQVELELVNDELILKDKSLKESEERFVLMFDRAPLGYQSLDLAGRFIEVNQQWLDTLGYTKEEVIGKWFGDFLTPIYKEGFRQRFPLFKQLGKIHSEFEMIHKNGAILFIAFEGRIGYDDKGDFKQTHCILQDITEKKKTQETLIESEEKYRLIVENSGLGVGVYSLDGTIQYFNQKALDNLGGKPEDYVGKSLIECFGEIRGAEYLKRFNEALKSDATLEFEDCIETVNGKKWFYSNQTVIKDANGTIKGIQVLAKDITERKLAEEKIKESEHFLLISQKIGKIGSYITELPSGEWSISPVMYNILGIDETYPNTFDGFLEFLHPDSKEEFIKYHSKVITESIRFDYKYKIIRVNDKAVRWVHGLGEIEYDENNINNPIRLIGTIQDITERKLAEEKLRESEEQFRIILENMPILLNAFDEKGNIIVWNKACEEATGYSAEEIINNPKAMELLYPDEIYREKVWNASLDSNNKVNTFDLTSKNRETKTVEWFDIYKYLSIPGWDSWGLGQDITERKRAEEKLKENEEKYRELVENSPDSIAIYEEGKLVFVNNELVSLLAAKNKEELIGKPVLQFIHPDSRELVVKRMKKVASDNATLPFVEEKALRLDGLAVDVEIKAIPIKLEGKNGSHEFSGD